MWENVKVLLFCPGPCSSRSSAAAIRQILSLLCLSWCGVTSWISRPAAAQTGTSTHTRPFAATITSYKCNKWSMKFRKQYVRTNTAHSASLCASHCWPCKPLCCHSNTPDMMRHVWERMCVCVQLCLNISCVSVLVLHLLWGRMSACHIVGHKAVKCSILRCVLNRKILCGDARVCCLFFIVI